MVIVQQAVVRHEMPRIQSNLPQDLLAVNSLMPDIVQRVAHPRACHSQTLVHFIEEYRNQGGLPIVAVEDVRMLVRFEHELQGRPTQKSNSFSIIRLAVKDAPV